MKKIAVLLSGGVDSSVALALLKQQGHDVTAFYLKIWLEDELSYLGSCPWSEDLEYARQVCEKFKVPLEIISMQQVYHNQVVSYMLAEIAAGRTPNPDVLCNQFVKFGAFYQAIDASFEYVATGHYAQIEHTPSLSILKKGVDPVKDQTYFLSNLSQAQLKRALFPIGHLLKSQVRQLAQSFDLPTATRKDSQGICFLGKFNFADFVRAHLGTKTGDLIEFETGKKLGVHDGFWFYTIGQRQGLGLSAGPWYVVAKDVNKNIVFISNQYDSVDQYKSGMMVTNMNWNLGYASDKTDLDVRFRHGPAVHPAIVSQEIYPSIQNRDAISLRANAKEIENYKKPFVLSVLPSKKYRSMNTINYGSQNLTIMLKQESQQGIAAGQFAVVYDGDICLGGGVIEKAL